MTTLFPVEGYVDSLGVEWQVGTAADANPLLRDRHYLGPLYSGATLVVIGATDGRVVAAQMWKHPTSRRLPSDGSWLELSRWCLTPEAGANAGSRQHRYAAKLIRKLLPSVTTLVSYSDPGHGHTGALYRACNWEWRPTWLRLRPPPGGHGDWGTGPQAVKDRWVFSVRRDPSRDRALFIDDPAAIRHWAANGTDQERRWANHHPQLREAS